MIENICLPEQAMDDKFVLLLLKRIDVSELNVRHLVERVFLEVVLLKVRVHVETRRSKVEGTRHIGDDTLTPLPDYI